MNGMRGRCTDTAEAGDLDFFDKNKCLTLSFFQTFFDLKREFLGLFVCLFFSLDKNKKKNNLWKLFTIVFNT
jgi:hypothetical protein